MPDDIIEREVLGEASRACGVLVDRVRGRLARKGGATAASSANTPPPRSRHTPKPCFGHCWPRLRGARIGDVEDWVRRQFHGGLDSAGTPLREAVADSPHRHAVAQGLQQKMFEAELMLRRALKARFSEAAGARLANAAAGRRLRGRCMRFQRKAAG